MFAKRLFQKAAEIAGLTEKPSSINIDDKNGLTTKNIAALATSRVINQRILFGTHVVDFCHEVGYVTAVQSIIPLIKASVKDHDKQVRTNSINQFGGLAGFLIQTDPENGYLQVCALLLPTLFDLLLHDADTQIRHHAAEALFVVASHLRIEERKDHILKRVLEMAASTNESLRELGVFILNGLAEALGPRLCQDVVAPRLVTLSDDPSVRVRRAVALNCGEVARVVGPDVCRAVILPSMFKLGVADEHHLVRKATLESLFTIALSVPVEARRQELANYLRRTLKDPSHQVTSAARQLLGPFVASLASSMSPQALVAAAGSRHKANSRGDQSNRHGSPRTTRVDPTTAPAALMPSPEVGELFAPDAGLCVDLIDEFLLPTKKLIDAELNPQKSNTAALAAKMITRDVTGDQDFVAAAACAFSIGGVVQAHGPGVWPLVKQGYAVLARHEQAVVRRSVAAATHVVAEVLLKRTDLLVHSAVASPSSGLTSPSPSPAILLSQYLHAPITELSTCSLPTFATSVPSTNNDVKSGLATKSPLSGGQALSRQSELAADRAVRIFASVDVFDANRIPVATELLSVVTRLLADADVDVVRALLLHISDFLACLPLPCAVGLLGAQVLPLIHEMGRKDWRLKLVGGQQLLAIVDVLAKAAEHENLMGSDNFLALVQKQTETLCDQLEVSCAEYGDKFAPFVRKTIETVKVRRSSSAGANPSFMQVLLYSTLLTPCLQLARDSNASVRRVGGMAVAACFRGISSRIADELVKSNRDGDEYLKQFSKILLQKQDAACVARERTRKSVVLDDFLISESTASSPLRKNHIIVANLEAVSGEIRQAVESADQTTATPLAEAEASSNSNVAVFRMDSESGSDSSSHSHDEDNSETGEAADSKSVAANSHHADSYVPADGTAVPSLAWAEGLVYPSVRLRRLPTLEFTGDVLSPRSHDAAASVSQSSAVSDYLLFGGMECAAAQSIVSNLAQSSHYAHRQVFVKLIDDLLRHLPRNIVILFFLRTLLRFASDRVANVRLVWVRTIAQHIRPYGRLVGISICHLMLFALGQVESDREVRSAVAEALAGCSGGQALSTLRAIHAGRPGFSFATLLEDFDLIKPHLLLEVDGLDAGELACAVSKPPPPKAHARQGSVALSHASTEQLSQSSSSLLHSATMNSDSATSAKLSKPARIKGSRSNPLVEEVFGRGGQLETSLSDLLARTNLRPLHPVRIVAPVVPSLPPGPLNRRRASVGSQRSEAVCLLQPAAEDEIALAQEVASELAELELRRTSSAKLSKKEREENEAGPEEDVEDVSPVPSLASPVDEDEQNSGDEFDPAEDSLNRVVHLETEFGEAMPNAVKPAARPSNGSPVHPSMLASTPRPSTATPAGSPIRGFNILPDPVIAVPQRKKTVGQEENGEEVSSGLGLPGGIGALGSAATFMSLEEEEAQGSKQEQEQEVEDFS